MPEDPVPPAPLPGPSRPGRRDRHGRGLRGRLVTSEGAAGRVVPLARTRRAAFGQVVERALAQSVATLADRWPELAQVGWAVEDVPPVPVPDGVAADLVTESGAGGVVPLGRLLRGGAGGGSGVVGAAGTAAPGVGVPGVGVPGVGAPRAGGGSGAASSVATVVVYRRPVQARAGDRAELADLVGEIVLELLADLVGVAPEDLDPERD